MLDEVLTWTEARDRCSQDNNGYLAVAKNVQEFKFLRVMYDKYRSRGGDANGAWLDGTYTNSNNTNKWICDSNGEGSDCPSKMPWTNGEPNNLDTERCILVWFTRTDGVANYMCNERMPAICATYR